MIMESEPVLLKGTVVTNVIERRTIRFFVVDATDHIQSFHLRGEFYEREELTLIERYCPRGVHIIDAGANVGNHAIFFDKFLGPKSVHVIEVNPPAIAVLRINVALNESHSIDTSWLGVGLAARPLRLDLEEVMAGNWGATRFTPAAEGKFQALPGDALAQGLPVGFLKLDVERMEMDVLAGFDATIETWRPPMFVEMADENAASFGAWLDAKRYKTVAKCQRYPGVWNYVVLPI
jgi:FkbM family methyltransferase